MNTTNPFANVDFTKFMGDYKMPMIDMEKLVTAQKKNFEVVAAANKLAAESVQSLFQGQANVARANFEEFTAAVQELATVGDPQDAVVRQTALAKDAYERTVGNLQDVNAAVTKTSAEVFDLLSKRVAEGLDEANGIAAKATKN